MRWAAVLVGVVCAGACSSSAGGEPVELPCDAQRTTLSIDGQDALVLAPPSLADGAPAPLVMYHHGVGEDENVIETDPQKQPLTCALLEAGYIVAGSVAHAENWGVQTAVDDYAALHDELAGDRTITDVMVLSQSMGGLTGLLSVAQGVPDVRAWAGIYPLTNLGFAYTQAQFTEAITAAHGGPPPASQDPVLQDPAVFAGVPMLIWASDGDTVVPKAENTGVLLELGVDAEVVDTVGDHGDDSNFDAATLVAFFDAHRAVR